MIEQIKHNKKLIAYIIRANNKIKKTTFYGEKKNFLQLGYIIKNKNDSIKRHKHKKIRRIIFGTPEILIIKDGKTEVKIYVKGAVIKKTILNKNDSISLIDCEHSFKFLKKTKLIEIKQGPYIQNEKIIYYD